MMGKNIISEGCGEFEVVFEKRGWKSKDLGYKLATFVLIEDYERIYKDTKFETFKLKEGEKPIKVTTYIVVDPSQLSKKIIKEYSVKGYELLSELYGDLGEFVEVPSLQFEFNTLFEADIYLNSKNFEEELDHIMKNADKFIYLNDAEKLMRYLGGDTDDPN